MKNRSRAHKSRRLIILSSIVVILGLAAGTSYYLVTKNDKPPAQLKVSPVNTVNYGPSSSQDNNLNNQRKSNPSSAAQTLDNGATNSGSSTSNTSLAAVITYARSSGTNGIHSISTAANVSGATSGTCTFTASMSGQASVTQTSQVEASNQDYICPAITLSLPVSGNWNVSVVLSSGTQSSPSSNWADNPVQVD